MGIIVKLEKERETFGRHCEKIEEERAKMLRVIELRQQQVSKEADEYCQTLVQIGKILDQLKTGITNTTAATTTSTTTTTTDYIPLALPLSTIAHFSHTFG